MGSPLVAHRESSSGAWVNARADRADPTRAALEPAQQPGLALLRLCFGALLLLVGAVAISTLGDGSTT